MNLCSKNIFISYRREGGDDFAGRLTESLRKKGYGVYRDIDDLRSGAFNQQLYKKIRTAKDVLVVLPENALDRCSNEEDWVRKEISYALKLNKNVVPIMLKGFTWPEVNLLPDDIRELPNQQGISPSGELYEESITRLTSKLIKSKPTCKYLRRISLVISIALIIFTTIVSSNFLKWPRQIKTDIDHEYLSNIAGSYELLVDKVPDVSKLIKMSQYFNAAEYMPDNINIQTFVNSLNEIIIQGLERRINGNMPSPNLLSAIKTASSKLLITIQMDWNKLEKLQFQGKEFYFNLLLESCDYLKINTFQTQQKIDTIDIIFFEFLFACYEFSKWNENFTETYNFLALSLLCIPKEECSSSQVEILESLHNCSMAVCINNVMIFKKYFQKSIDLINQYAIEQNKHNLNDKYFDSIGITIKSKSGYRTFINKTQ
jgi:hypothetical protein